MKRLMTSLTLAAMPISAMADPGDGRYGDYGHMMGGWGFGLFGGVMMIAFWGVVIGVIVLVVRWVSENGKGRDQNDAMNTLRQRFAAGEIDEEEFTRRKKALES